jgi:Domain of unknown function (DUF4266)
MKLMNRCLLMALILSAAACTEVMPRQRGNLALSQMAFTTDGLEFGLRQHTSFSKESAAGGYGGGGGGCGCN